MHELGIVFHIADDVMEIAAQNQVDHVQKVILDVGEVSTIVPYYLIDCWNWNAKRYPVLKDCILQVETIEAITWCDGCKSTYPTVEHGKICPHCHSENTWLQQGNEVIIREIEVDA